MHKFPRWTAWTKLCRSLWTLPRTQDVKFKGNSFVFTFRYFVIHAAVAYSWTVYTWHNPKRIELNSWLFRIIHIQSLTININFSYFMLHWVICLWQGRTHMIHEKGRINRYQMPNSIPMHNFDGTDSTRKSNSSDSILMESAQEQSWKVVLFFRIGIFRVSHNIEQKICQFQRFDWLEHGQWIFDDIVYCWNLISSTWF